MAKLRAEDIVFWILILIVIGMAIWLAFGSPDFEKSLIMIIIFVASSMIVLWKALFTFDRKNMLRLSTIDKRTSVGFERVRSDFKIVNNKLQSMDNRLSNIESSVNRIEKKLK